jgi:hypothetical protein
MKTTKRVLGGSIVAALLLMAAPSFADDVQQSTDQSGDTKYKFEDDPLSAGGFGPADATIRVRPGPVRTTLIRPRTSFVPEMLKSVENI